MRRYFICKNKKHRIYTVCGVSQTPKLSLESRLTENGSNLSSGERQRLIMARGLLRKPEVLVVDEITSHLDEASERKLWDKLFKQYSDVTFIVISHRMDIINYVKRVCVMNDGKIVLDVCSQDFCREEVDE